MNTKLYLILFIIFIFTTDVCAQNKGRISEKISVTGLIKNPFTIHLKNMGAFNIQEVRHPNHVIGRDQSIKREIHSFKGILLRDIIDSAQVQMPLMKDRGEFFITIKATDGYNVIFSYNELYYGPAGENTYVIFEINEEPVHDGPFIVFCSSDIITGPRHVKWVEEIETGRIQTQER